MAERIKNYTITIDVDPVNLSTKVKVDWKKEDPDLPGYIKPGVFKDFVFTGTNTVDTDLAAIQAKIDNDDGVIS